MKRSRLKEEARQIPLSHSRPILILHGPIDKRPLAQCQWLKQVPVPFPIPSPPDGKSASSVRRFKWSPVAPGMELKYA